MGSGRPANNRPKRTAKKRVSAPIVAGGGVFKEPLREGGDQVSISLGDLGSVELTVKVRWLELPDETFIALRRIVTELKGLAVEEDESVGEENDL